MIYHAKKTYLSNVIVSLAGWWHAGGDDGGLAGGQGSRRATSGPAEGAAIDQCAAEAARAAVPLAAVWTAACLCRQGDGQAGAPPGGSPIPQSVSYC